MPTAATTNTYKTSEMKGIREDLSPVISRIDPTETPFYSNAKGGTAKNIQWDWQVQELAAPRTDNRAPEGFTAAPEAAKPTVRLYNIAQILTKEGKTSDTADAVDTAGREKESVYQEVLKGLELRRDVEVTLLHNQVRDLSDPRAMSGLPVYLPNVSVGAGGAAPVGDGSNLPTAGTARPISMSLIDDALEMAFKAGGKPRIAMMSTAQKRKVSKLSGVVQNEYTMSSVKEAAIIGSVSVYLSDFGRVDFVVNIFHPDHTINLLDPDHYAVKALAGRRFKKTDLAKRGSATEFMIEFEGGLEVDAPKAHAAVRDLSV